MIRNNDRKGLSSESAGDEKGKEGKMTRKQRRSVFIFSGLGVLAFAVGLVLFALEDSIVFFYSPSDVVEKKLQPNQRFRLGGLVETGSVQRGEGTVIRFKVTDNAKTIPVIYKGVLPDLFREEQGVITEGKLNAAGLFVADSVLAKHDESYMPREVAESLKKKGLWKKGAKGEMTNGQNTSGQTPADKTAKY